MQIKALYPGTFDPMTLGHMDIINRSLELFDTVVIAVAESSRKSTILDLNERVEICNQLYKNNARIVVKKFNTLTVDFAEQENCTWIVKGVRNANDFEYELQMAAMNQQMSATIKTVFLPADPRFIHVSSTMVREIISLGKIKEAALFVPPVVLNYLERKL